MSSFSRKQVVRVCILTALVTAVVGLAFVEVAYWPARRAVAGWFRGEEPGQTPRPRAADMRDTSTLRIAAERTQQILLARDSLLGLEKQKELMRLWHELRIWQNMWYLGIRIQKNPMDLWMMQQILYDIRPDYIIEAGTAYGGSALYWSHILDGLGLPDSRVITIDIRPVPEPVTRQPLWQKHVQFIHGSSTDPEIVEQIREMVEGKTVLVTLDSNHEAYHVLGELQAYGPMVSPGSYIVVEDTNLDGLPLPPELSHLEGPGPMSAVVQYLEGEGGALFENDTSRENFILTFNSGGWLRRKTDPSWSNR